MSREQITGLLNSLVRRAAENKKTAEFFERPHPNGEGGKKLKMRCSFELLPHQSLLLKDLLRKGLLQEVQLISHEARNLDQNFVETAHSVTIGVSKEGASLTFAALKNAFNATRIDADKLVLKFTDPDTGNVTAKTIAANDLEQAMTKRDILKFDADLQPCYTHISEDIIRQMMQHL